MQEELGIGLQPLTRSAKSPHNLLSPTEPSGKVRGCLSKTSYVGFIKLIVGHTMLALRPRGGGLTKAGRDPLPCSFLAFQALLS